MEIYNENITKIKGIGPKKAELLNKVGISAVGELLYCFPSRYDFYKYYDSPDDINESGKAVFCIEYDGTAKRKYSPQTGYYVKWQCRSERKNITFTWFNQPYIVNSLVKNKKYCVKCDIEYRGSTLSAVNPHFTVKCDLKGSIFEPAYRTPSGISSNQFAGFVRNALEFAGGKLQDDIPEELREKYDIPALKEALEEVHFPTCEDDAVHGMRRFIFEEFFMFAIRRVLNKREADGGNAAVDFDIKATEDFLSRLPYRLTNAQKAALSDIARDMHSDKPMNRIVQGDVGSGKTVVAFAACLMAKSGGRQSVIMAPTEVLARQHMKSFEELFFGVDIKASLLTGSLSAKEKNAVKKSFTEGESDVLIGTQAVLEENVSSENVGLVITDEQHRFGVRQRLNLKNKGNPVNMLLLTATPIPRTLSLVVYSDLDVSVIDEMPEGRIPVKTYCRRSDARQKVYAFAVNEIKSGHRVYVICPSVDDEDENKASVKRMYEALSKNELKNVKCAALYGAMKPKDKDNVMNKFAKGDIDVLISTTVVEVGVNVPEATVMIVENAERFGLAQLHQLRGRVGRGSDKSYCILISDSDSPTARARLEMLEKTNNGFEIAQEDMRLRGQGEYFGLRQHGVQQFRYGELPRDAFLFQQAASAAQLVEDDKEKYADFYNSACETAQRLNAGIVFN